MKHLILMRHGKSSWEQQVFDRERPLKKRGQTEAKLVAQKFKSLQIQVDGIYSSPAQRALSTAYIFTDTMDINSQEVTIENNLYDFSGELVSSVIRGLPDSKNNIIIFGHNHAFTALANFHGDLYIDNLPTSGLVFMSFKTNHWAKLSKGKTEHIITPKNLR